MQMKFDPCYAPKWVLIGAFLLVGVACSDDRGNRGVNGWEGYAGHGKGFVTFKNLVSNSGMEQDLPDTHPHGWLNYANGEKNSATFSVTADEAHTGNHSLHAQINSADGVQFWAIGAGPGNIPVEPNTQYQYSAWVKGAAGANLDVNITLTQEPWTTFGTLGETTLSGEWQEITLDVTVGDTRTVRATMQLNFTVNSGKNIYIDDVQFVLKTN